MTGPRAPATVLDRVIRVRRVRARQALAALGRNRARQAAEAALGARVAALLGDGVGTGPVAAGMAAARAAADTTLGRLADDVGARLAITAGEGRRLAERLAQAQAAVDAAVARRAERETGQ